MAGRKLVEVASSDANVLGCGKAIKCSAAARRLNARIGSGLKCSYPVHHPVRLLLGLLPRPREAYMHISGRIIRKSRHMVLALTMSISLHFPHLASRTKILLEHI